MITAMTQTDTDAFDIKNDEQGFAILLEQIRHLRYPLVVFESSGGYERKLADFLQQQAIPYALVNPTRVRAFARSEGIKAKTDPIDARILLRFAQEKRLCADTARPKEESHLAELLDRRTQLSEQHTKEKNRLEKQPKHIVQSIQRMQKYIEKEIARIDQQIKTLVENTLRMKERYELYCSVCGVGPITAWSLLAYLEELPRLSRNQAVALVGIAPYNRDSGATQGKRRIYAGRAKLRRCLYMATQSAAMHNPVIKEYVAGLRARGKTYKCAIIAAMRKILLHLRSIIINNQLCSCS
jgi:transposase